MAKNLNRRVALGALAVAAVGASMAAPHFTCCIVGERLDERLKVGKRWALRRRNIAASLLALPGRSDDDVIVVVRTIQNVRPDRAIFTASVAWQGRRRVV